MKVTEISLILGLVGGESGSCPLGSSTSPNCSFASSYTHSLLFPALGRGRRDENLRVKGMEVSVPAILPDQASVGLSEDQLAGSVHGNRPCLEDKEFETVRLETLARIFCFASLSL